MPLASFSDGWSHARRPGISVHVVEGVDAPFQYALSTRAGTECVGHFDEPQCVVVCPVECIDPDPDIPETQEALLAKLHGLQRDHPELYVESAPE